MARGRKKETLAPEERLQAALVPESQQPYPVPENWCWIRGISFLKPMETSRPEGEEFRYIDIDAIDNKRQQVMEPKILLVKDAPSRASRKLRTGDTLFSMVRPYLMNIAYIDETLSDCIASTGFYVCTPAEFVNSLYLYYLMKSPYTVEGLNQYMKGDNSPSIRKNDIEDYAYPLPPLAEQQRIVDRIESLFAKLDEAREKAQDALDGFETRRAAILHKAFTGELTAQWRKEHGVGMESWKKSRFDEVAIIKSNLVDPTDYPDFPHIAPDNIEKKTGVLLEYHTIAEDGVTSGKHRFYQGQILYSKIRPYLSKAVVVDFDGLCSADMYPIEAKGNTKCLWYYMLSEEFLEQASSAGSRSVLPKINQKELSALTIFLPTLSDEQTEIVNILDDLFVKEQQAKEAAESVLEQIDLIKKSILARAFRGELGTNDPSEESSIGLLERSFSEIIAVEEAVPKQEIEPKAEVVFVPKTIMEALQRGVRLTPEKLKSETGLPIDDFYAQLKELIENGSVAESRENGDSYLEAANENRQTENR